jgi:hypothetical protein
MQFEEGLAARNACLLVHFNSAVIDEGAMVMWRKVRVKRIIFL